MKRERELEVDEAQTLKTAASLAFIVCEWTNVALELTRPWRPFGPGSNMGHLIRPSNLFGWTHIVRFNPLAIKDYFETNIFIANISFCNLVIYF